MNDTQLPIVDVSQKISSNEDSPEKEKKFDAAAMSWYGETFTGYMLMPEIKDLVPSFKEFYYTERIKDPNAKLTTIVKDFNKMILPRKFHPYMKNISQWKVKWDADILATYQNKKVEVATTKNIYQIIKTKDDENNLLSIDDSSLEEGVKTLGGELLNDAMQMLKDDQNSSRWQFADETLVKRRNYIVGVFAHVTKLVHGKAALVLKASEEKRNNAGFFMELLARASSGKLSEEDMVMLKSNYPSNKEVIEVTSNG